MKILKVFNNNVALAVDQFDKEVIVMGKGLVFGKKTGDLIDETVVEKVFVLQDESVSTFSDLYESTRPEVIDALLKIVDLAEDKLSITLKSSAYLALVDHINFAIERQEQGINLENPLSWEVKKFYPQEHAIGLQALALIEDIVGVQFSESEATSIALHLVNASKQGDHLEQTIKITKIVRDILNIVRNFYGINFDEESITYSRFVTHLQFFAQRIVKNIHHGEVDSFLYEQVKTSYPKAFECTLKIMDYAERVYRFIINKDEQVYLSIHIQRSITQSKIKQDNS
ncbi:PRD domain-containing protein [Tuanshanicoccus lijuaniae]|uniref:BglG family transcription antiterminator LicT n=1 Tax=Aerococcaceae bacterium zg-1292 TaxID=2774330 RepID=UPI001938A1EF|nr:PRD domain-containing protein [Aerococcaceae bacterium zg-1292]QQA37755.1 PRD domain-containing protein [Aerococcaceae bacterium zg-1292]